MLSLAEKLMLLALHDEKRLVLFSASRPLPYELAGALMLDLLFRGRIKLRGKKIHLVDSTPVGNTVLDEALSLIQRSNKERSAKYWMQKFSRAKKDLKSKVTDGLVRKKILKREGHRVLWVFNINRFATQNQAPESEIRNKIRNIVLLNHEADEEDVALLSLLRACELTKEVFLKSEYKFARRRIKGIKPMSRSAKRSPHGDRDERRDDRRYHATTAASTTSHQK